MEADRRLFEAISISLSSVETGSDRYARHEFSPPPHSNWRCNLTALSQRYNMYFMASREDILVFEPDFPFQKLGRQARLLIPPALAEPRAFGYLDWLGSSPGPHPHAINHLVVGDLGFEEILLVSTDSGNIAAYHTKAIFDAIQKDPYKFSPDGRADLVGLRPFLSHWVHESAWGLTIHKAARMIAVSANTPTFIQSNDPSAKITVFAFALTSPTSPACAGHGEGGPMVFEESQADWHEWDPTAESQIPPPRDRNYKILLAGEDGHTNNIPSISFVNTREDLQGSWLLSCDIYGDLKCWEIWKRKCYHTWDFAETSGPGYRRRQRQTDGGWIVAALDNAAFRPTYTLEAFGGHRHIPQYYGYLGTGRSYDITSTVRLNTPGRSEKHPLNADVSDEDENEVPDAEEIGKPWCESDSEGSITILGATKFSSNHQAIEGSPCMGPSQQLSRGSSINADRTTRSQSESSARVSNHRVPELSNDNNQLPGNSGGDNIAPSIRESESMDSDSDDNGDHELIDQIMDEADEGGSEDDSASYADSIRSITYLSDQTQRTSIEVDSGPLPPTISPEASGDDLDRSQSGSALSAKRGLQSQSEPVESRPTHIPYIPTLHLSQSHLRLINLPLSRSPHFFCANILKQQLPDPYNHAQINSLQRLNMLQQIPNLGIIVIGSQLGRVAVCSLTCIVPDRRMPGIRVDWILPTRRQERKGVRPKNHELLGIAVAPVQGRQSTPPSACDDDEDEEQEEKDAEKGETWAQNRNVGGVETTFDDQVVVLSNLDSRDHDSWSSEDDLQRQRGNQKAFKRSRKKQQSEHATRSRRVNTQSINGMATTSTEYRHWPNKPKQPENWETIEGTRRYRLMMTYADMTVLTYEIGRGLERDEIAVSEQPGGVGYMAQSSQV